MSTIEKTAPASSRRVRLVVDHGNQRRAPMKSIDLTYAAALCLGLPVMGASLVASRAATVPQVVSQGMPPATLNGAYKGRVVFPTNNPEVFPLASYSMSDKYVTILWNTKIGVRTTISSRQVEPVDYWPTDLCYFGRNKLIVAGKRDQPGRGHTVIELIEFSPVGDAPALIQGKPGRMTHPPFCVPIASRETLYDAAVPGRDMVTFMFRNEGRPSSLFIQFWDSRDLYSFDTTTKEMKMILSPTAGLGVEVVPASPTRTRVAGARSTKAMASSTSWGET